MNVLRPFDGNRTTNVGRVQTRERWRNVEEYGVFLGGKDVEGANPYSTAFILKRTGQAAILQRRGT